MTEVPKPLPKYERPFTEADLNRLKSEEDRWFLKGSWLYHCAEDIFARQSSLSKLTDIVVGVPIGQLIDSSEFSGYELEVIAGMLYGMACECWLKGLVLMAIPRPSRALNAKLRDLTASLPSTGDGIESVAERYSQLSSNPAACKLTAAIEQAEAMENENRAMVLKRLSTHNLVLLAKRANVVSDLIVDDLEFLDFLSKANTLGRYPAAMEVGGLKPWGGVLANRTRRERIADAIHKRHDQLQVMVFQGKGT